MSERVLLTGIAGYIGQHCGAELLKAGYAVVGTVRSQKKAAATRSTRLPRGRRGLARRRQRDGARATSRLALKPGGESGCRVAGRTLRR
jgi:nucleoside-diphosphate-sugar epimerase